MTAPAQPATPQKFFDFDSGMPTDNPDGPPEPIPASAFREGEVAPTGTEYVDATADPEYANRAAALADEANAESEELLLEPGEDGEVRLCAGVVIDGQMVTSVELRELNGADEETIGKIKSGNLIRYIDTILRCGVVRIGDVEGKEIPRLLDGMLAGDRDLLAMHIRRVTFGDTIRLDVKCPNCNGSPFQVDYSLTKDVPIRTLEDAFKDDESLDPNDREFILELPSKRTAVVKMIDGAAQKATFSTENAEKSNAELDTEMLRNCVISIDGRPVRGVGAVRDSMSARDRRFLLKWLGDHTVGPRYEEVTQECDECDQSFPLILDVLTLFRYE